MQSFVDYIESTFQGTADDGTLYRYKRQLLGKMTERANEVTHAGLHDDRVLNDLIISGFARQTVKNGATSWSIAL